jgi:putative ABC transport system permease protein
MDRSRAPLPARLAAFLVPRARRRAWLAEWAGEVAWARTRIPPGRAGWEGRLRLGVRTAWCVADALVLRAEEISMEGTIRGLRFALRGLVRNPLFSTLSVLTLALGIGATSAIFTVVNGVLLEPLPFQDEETLVAVGLSAPRLGYDDVPLSQGSYLYFRDRLRTLDGLALYQSERMALLGGGEPQEVAAARVTPSFFEVLGVGALLGRTFTVDEGRPGAEAVAVLSEGLWTERFGADPSVLGRVVEMDGVQRRIVGVMPASLRYPGEETRVWRPMEIDEATAPVMAFGQPGIGRLAPGASVADVGREVQGLLAGLGEYAPDQVPPAFLENAGLVSRVEPLRARIVGDISRALWVVLGTVAAVLLIACANVANLFLVRAESRSREVALRTALGADRGSLSRLFLGEGLVLAALAGVIGLALAHVGVGVFVSLAPAGIPLVSQIAVDGTVLAVTAGLALGTGLLFGMIPVWRAGPGELSSTLRDAGGRGRTAGRRAQRARNGLVISQVALALVLLIGSGLMLRSFQALRSVDLGFRAEHVLTVPLAPSGASYRTPGERLALYEPILDLVQALPGVEQAALADHVPLDGRLTAGPFYIEGIAETDADNPPIGEAFQVTPGYFEALSIRVLRGRGLTRDDDGRANRGVVVSRATAETWWGGEDALGRRLSWNDDRVWYTVVGVVDDVRFRAPDRDPDFAVYFPLVAGDESTMVVPNGATLTVRTTGDPMDLLPAVREAVWSVDPNLPITRALPAEELVARATSRTSFTVLLLGLASSIALVLGAVGIYGVIAYVVGQRRQEIGVRMALGARAGSVRRMILVQGLGVVGAGAALGLVVALALSSVMEGLLFGVTRLDPWTYGGVTAVLLTVAAAASWLPAWRASRVDPVQALRAE